MPSDEFGLGLCGIAHINGAKDEIQTPISTSLYLYREMQQAIEPVSRESVFVSIAA